VAGWLSAALRAPTLGAACACVLVFTPVLTPVWAQAGPAICSTHPAAAQTAACAAQVFAEAEETIAVLFADVRRALSAHERPQLSQEHSAWRRERGRRCPAPPKSGLTANSEAQHYACLTRETQARRQGVMRWLSMDSPATLP